MTSIRFTCCLWYSAAKRVWNKGPQLCMQKPALSVFNRMASITDSALTDSAPKRIRSSTPVIGTHSGTFHCDEVLACFMLKQLPEYENATIFRSRDDKALHEKCDIIVDVGGEFDHQQKLYDHHQKSFEETFSSLRPELGDEYKIRLSSAGLIYVHYGERIIESILQKHKEAALSPKNLKLSFIQIYQNFISEIDAIDNGVPMYENVGEPLYRISTHLSSRVHRLNPSWEDVRCNETEQKLFEQALELVGKEFVNNVLAMAGSWIRGREYVRKALEQATSVYETGEILVLERFCPWKVHLFDLEKEYNVEGIPKLVLFSENEHSWRVAGVPISPASFLGRKFLPLPWRGLRDEELSKVADIPDLIFVHSTGFIGGAKTKEAALQMALKSVQWQDK
ncbi:MYG1 protein isoform X1 [Anastrepha ludens]|uniref:MYG1 protein isoform X1 n=2 Tax=Anastrepha ludens TaxID=28586 RepID=UPI0023AEA37E|nr:MYG1 protein isoform X1 [Anastrepha ludens]XP_053969696.1 MYG1 protein isoform X1 [Anastrepha ludens]